MVSYADPQVRAVKEAVCGTHVDVYFSKPMDASTIQPDSILVSAAAGAAIAGSVRAKEPVEANGKTLTEAIRYTPAEPIPDGAYKLTVSGKLASYAGIAIGSDTVRDIAIVRRDETPPGDVADLTVGVTLGVAIVAWDDPDDDDYAKARIRWKKAGESAFGEPVEVAKGVKWTQIPKMPDAAGYEFKVSAVDESGNESPGITAGWGAADDWTPPLAVADLRANAVHEDRIVLGWTDPASSDLAKLRLTWAKEASPDNVHSVDVQPGAGTFTPTSLAPDTAYVVSIVAVDRSGNELSAAANQVRTKAASDPGTGGGYGGYGGGSADRPTADPNTSEAKAGPDGGAFRAFDGLVLLEAAKGAFSSETKLTLKRSGGPHGELPTGYSRMSESVTISAAGETPVKPLRLTLKFDSARLGNVDERRFGIYKMDSASSSGWTYTGGIVDTPSGTVVADISSYGEYAILLYARPFIDLNAHWSRSDVEVLVSRHIVDGASADSFEPDRPITRAEVTKLLVESLPRGQWEAPSDQTESSSAFADVSRDAWYVTYVATAVRIGLAEGADNRFRPNDAVTREELAVLLRRFAGLHGIPHATSPSASLDRFADARDISGWAREAMAAAVSQGRLQGMTETELKPLGEASRAQSATLLLRVLTSLGVISK